MPAFWGSSWWEWRKQTFCPPKRVFRSVSTTQIQSCQPNSHLSGSKDQRELRLVASRPSSTIDLLWADLFSTYSVLYFSTFAVAAKVQCCPLTQLRYASQDQLSTPHCQRKNLVSKDLWSQCSRHFWSQLCATSPNWWLFPHSAEDFPVWSCFELFGFWAAML